ncbi:MAG: ABC transporter permease, partial [Chloroflexi bacterium]|nr:ABC transporter permease [Chloroflexota bacterium]
MANFLRRLLNPRAGYKGIPSMADSVAAATGAAAGEVPAGARNRIRWQDVVFNLPFMLGTLIVLALFVLSVLGPVLAPQNPYLAGQHIVPHFDAELNVFIRPPLDPSPEYPLGTNQWGTDILSLIMHGARNTLIACAFITMMRVLLGLTLGVIAGWNEGKTSDRLIMGAIGLLTALPILISSVILILALDIRRGLLVFIIALSVLGWTEIAQYIRSEFLVLRKQAYIEGARATGLNGLEIAVRHVLPNILPQLLIISFLEMGAVLMLLGELGFLGIFIGGGSRMAVEDIGSSQVFTIAEVPEWGAMIADGFRWLRSKPFIVFYPATAFFIAVMGFNALGEGLRRLLEKGRINTAFLLRKRMLLVVAAVTLATVFIMNNTGAAPWFAQVAQSFDGQKVVEHVEALADMEGRGIGQPGGAAAAAYIADQFAESGLEPGWRENSYIYTTETTIVRASEQPALRLLDETGATVAEYRHQLDFGYVIEG